MVTKEQIDLFIKYDGDLDTFLRIRSINDRKILDEDTFRRIDLIVQEIIRMENGVLESKYLEKIQTDLKDNEIDAKIIEILYHKFGR
ncbi:MAG: hypothetical protein C4539_00535 [Ignavibacteriales bacterium]|nr:MAG: hypothetical protein C4539_00535 [Ignavibacteriales bacterium]